MHILYSYIVWNPKSTEPSGTRVSCLNIALAHL